MLTFTFPFLCIYILYQNIGCEYWIFKFWADSNISWIFNFKFLCIYCTKKYFMSIKFDVFVHILISISWKFNFTFLCVLYSVYCTIVQYHLKVSCILYTLRSIFVIFNVNLRHHCGATQSIQYSEVCTICSWTCSFV